MSKIIKILIVDDEPLAHDLLESYCAGINFIEVVGHCYDGLSTLNFINENEVDALLLDIQMPDITGIELAQNLEVNGPKIVFTTAYTEYALQSFDFDQVVDYLKKPIRLPRFIKAMERLKKQLKLETTEIIAPVSTHQTNQKMPESLVIKEDKITYRIPITDIAYLQSWGNYIKIFSKQDEVRIARQTISELEAELKACGFQRIHKSFLVNIKSVRALEGNQVVIDDVKLPIGRAYKNESFHKLTNAH